MNASVVRSSDGGLTFLVGGVAYPIGREDATRIVAELLDRNPELAATLAALLAEDAS